jgi:hypothetical protein
MNCIWAEPGHFVDETGATSQRECAPGTYQPNPAMLSCIQASVGSYVSGFAAISQSTCADGTTSTVQSSTSCLPVIATTVPQSTNKKLAKGKKAKLSSMIKPTKGAKLKWAASGGCKISGLYIVAPKKVATCSLSLKQTITSGTKSKKTTTSSSRIGITVS